MRESRIRKQIELSRLFISVDSVSDAELRENIIEKDRYKKLSMTSKRVEWALKNKSHILSVIIKECPKECKAKCSNGLTCKKSSSGGFGWWVHALLVADIDCEPMNFWSGTYPTPSTSINKGIADFICKFAPEEIRGF